MDEERPKDAVAKTNKRPWPIPPITSSVCYQTSAFSRAALRLFEGRPESATQSLACILGRSCTHRDSSCLHDRTEPINPTLRNRTKHRRINNITKEGA